MSLEAKIGHMLIAGFRGLALDHNSPIFRDIQERHLGGIILFDYDSALKSPERNVQSPSQVAQLIASLQDAAQSPLLIGIDQEGGRVNRLKERFGFPPTVSAQYLGELNNLEQTRRYAASTAQTLSLLGININFAPVVDLNVNADCPVIGQVERSFSANPDVVTAHARCWIQEHHAWHIACALKHFPGHGSATKDTHLDFVDVTENWSPDELLPYRQLIDEGLCDMVMTSHIFHAGLDPKWPATLSHPVLHDLLRVELGYDGVIISDDLQMKAVSAQYSLETIIRQALHAGVDLLTFGNNLHYDEHIVARVAGIVKNFISHGLIPEERIEQSYRRICRLKNAWT